MVPIFCDPSEVKQSSAARQHETCQKMTCEQTEILLLAGNIIAKFDKESIY